MHDHLTFILALVSAAEHTACACPHELDLTRDMVEQVDSAGTFPRSGAPC